MGFFNKWGFTGVTAEMSTILYSQKLNILPRLTWCFFLSTLKNPILLGEAQLSTAPGTFHPWVHEAAGLLWHPAAFVKQLFRGIIPPDPTKTLVLSEYLC